MTSVGDKLLPQEIRPTEVQLFRFSAATWNAHRIHYDAAYAVSEGYPDVLVQSHLHACYLTNYVIDWAGAGAQLRRIKWQNRSIATPRDVLTLSGRIVAVEKTDSAQVIEAELSTHREDGVLCVSAHVTIEVGGLK